MSFIQARGSGELDQESGFGDGEKGSDSGYVLERKAADHFQERRAQHS